MAHINLTPRWEEILPNWLLMYREAVRGNARDPDKTINNAEAEFERMAQGTDNFNDLVTYLRNTQGWKDDRLKQAIVAGRELNETARNTVHEDS